MAVNAAKTWIAGEVLTASELNAEFLNIYNNGQTLAFPATTSKDFDGQDLVLDVDGDTTLDATLDDVIVFTLGGVEIFKMDGNAGTMVTGFDFTGQVTGVDPSINVTGETNTGLDIKTKGTGVVDITTGLTIDDDEVVSILGQQVFA